MYFQFLFFMLTWGEKKNLLPFIFTTQTQWQTNREEENCFFPSNRSDSINRNNINDLSSWFWLRCIELKTFCCVHLLSVTKTIVKCHTAKIKSNELKSFWLSSCYLTSYNKTQQQTKPSQVLYTKYIYKLFFSPVMSYFISCKFLFFQAFVKHSSMKLGNYIFLIYLSHSITYFVKYRWNIV